ncbi:MAG: hypothetical protein WCV88_05660 [Patescibacteria group bacterium]|jgi:hypothetical protein
MRQIWQEELSSHVLDCADDLVKLGYDQAAALVEAKKRFGDEDKIVAELKTIHPWLAAYADWIVLGLLAFSLLPLAASYYFASPYLSLVSEQLIIWWFTGSFVVLTGLLVKWQLHIIPLTNRLSIYVAVSIGFFISSCINIALDINNFEVIVYNGLFGLVIILILELGRKPLNIYYKKTILLVCLSLMIIFAWRENGFLQDLIFPNCLFIVDNNPTTTQVAGCTRISFFSIYLLFIYAFSLITLGFIGYYLVNLWKAGSGLFRKVITTGVFVLLPLSAMSVSGVNSLGVLDVVPWKLEIYQTYVDILGRRPEQKDYDFYARTRSYEHMSQVRAVLYSSKERRVKIKDLFQTTLHRPPTKQELNYYANKSMTISEIQTEIQTK